MANNAVTEITIGAEAIVSLPFSNECGESPFWSPTDEAFFWVDIPAGRIHRWSPASGASASWQLPEQVGCIARQRDGNMLAACETGIYSVSLQPGEPQIVKLVGIEHPAPNMRFNDGRCDRRGRMWVTTFMDRSDRQAVGGLFRYTQDGLSPRLLDGFLTPNGTAFSPDNRTMYIADSHASVRKVWAIDFDIENGVLGERRVFIDMAPYAGRPDGATVDTEGYYWVAGMDDGCIMRFYAARHAGTHPASAGALPDDERLRRAGHEEHAHYLAQASWRGMGVRYPWRQRLVYRSARPGHRWKCRLQS